MELILLEKVVHLGNLGDKVNVRPGYGRNYLLPQGKAVLATKENLEVFEARRAELERAQEEELAKAQRRAEQVDETTLVIERKVASDSEGKLFGSVGPADVVEAAKLAGIELNKREVLMAEGPLRSVGEFELKIRLHPDVIATLRVDIIAEE